MDRYGNWCSVKLDIKMKGLMCGERGDDFGAEGIACTVKACLPVCEPGCLREGEQSNLVVLRKCS